VAARTTGHLVLNRDDPRLAALAGSTGAAVSYFGVSAGLRPLFPTDEELYGGQIELSELPASAVLESLELAETTRIELTIAGAREKVELRADGGHNAQNAAAAAALAVTFGLPPDVIADGLRAVQPAFGRGQSFALDGRRVVLQLVKNPAGFRQSLRTIGSLQPAATVIAINDDYADGRDMSWLWDVEFGAALRGQSGYLSTSGTRAADMAVRLHYDELEVEATIVDLATAVEDAVRRVKPAETVVVFATYTAMWHLHRVLADRAEVAG
jgi:UDP-N-acetylmuramyl tripeptide synthase